METWVHRSSGTTIAVKIYTKPKKEPPVEVEILKSLPLHDSIIKIFGYLPKTPALDGDVVMFEFCPKGDLFDFVKFMWKHTRSVFSEKCIWSIFRQLAAALAFLHSGIGW